MAVEALTAGMLLVDRPSQVLAAACGIGFILVAVIWLSTILLQVPGHKALASGLDLALHRKLVRANWIRTVAWSLRGIVVLFMVHCLLAAGAPEGK